MTYTNPLIDYTARFHESVGATGATSALGAWLLAASTGRAVHGNTRVQLSAELGMDALEAAELADALLTDMHPAVRAALAVWVDSRLTNRGFERFASTLPAMVEHGPVPTQQEADSWAQRNTYGMIPHFPADMDQADVVFASALATDIAWETPYEVRPGTELGGGFGRRSDICLHGYGVICNTDAAGVVAVHERSSDNNMSVISVIADPSIPPAQVHRAALELVTDGIHAHQVPLEKLPSAPGHSWTISEQEGFGDHVEVFLPCWEIDEKPFSIDDAPAIGPLKEMFGALLGTDGPAEAIQKVFAEYGQQGFRAAAITTMRLGRGMPVLRTVRVACVQFNRPYVAVAYTTNPHECTWENNWEPARPSPWDRLPVFSTWVEHSNVV